jgi:SOS response regulatory protein OraA/RecX
MKKGVDKKVIEEALSQKDIDEEKMAKKLIKKRSYKWEKYKGQEKRKKMADFLARKGFNWDVIKPILKDI